MRVVEKSKNEMNHKLPHMLIEPVASNVLKGALTWLEMVYPRGVCGK